MIKEISRFAIRFGLLPIAYVLLRLYFTLIRMRSEGEEELKDRLRTGGKVIAALWHQRILIVLGYARRFAEFAPAVMISRSRDGEMIADVYRRLKFRPVRGSSSRGGREALSTMIADLAEHPLAIHVVDGPQGPRGVVKAGLISMATAFRRPDRSRFYLREPGLGAEKLGSLLDSETIQHGLCPLGRAACCSKKPGRGCLRGVSPDH